MNSHKKTAIIVLAISVFLSAAVVGSVVGINAYLDNQYSSLHQGCSRQRTSFEVVVENDTVIPNHIDAKKCDTLTVKNLDDVDRIMAFGVHDDHIAYDGAKEHELRTGESFTVTLVQTGEFLFHDHMKEDVKGTFTVK